MISVNRRQTGFTIVELLIVIVVIGILAGLVITTFNGIQQKARDTERETDIKAIHAQVEAFWAQKGYYPSLVDLNDRAATIGFVAVNLKGLDSGAFQDPKGASATLVAAPVASAYAYDVEPNACDTAGSLTCVSYTLTSTLEGTLNGSGIYAKTSLNN